MERVEAERVSTGSISPSKRHDALKHRGSRRLTGTTAGRSRLLQLPGHYPRGLSLLRDLRLNRSGNALRICLPGEDDQDTSVRQGVGNTLPMHIAGEEGAGTRATCSVSARDARETAVPG